MSNILQDFSDSMADAVHSVRDAVAQLSDEKGSVGAGTIWHSDGLILTNAHVVLRRNRYGSVSMPSMTVTLPDNRRFPAQLIASDTDNDIAALAIDAVDLPTIPLGDSRAIRPGQWVMAVGHPWGVRDATTAGVVIGSGDQLPEMAPGREWIALNLTLRPGHSGGPLVDTDGHLLGINTMITGPEVGFAVPVHVMKAFLKQHLGRNVSSAVTV